MCADMCIAVGWLCIEMHMCKIPGDFFLAHYLVCAAEHKSIVIIV